MAKIIGTTGDDALVGTSANDTLTGLAGNDTYSGGRGIDVAIFSGTLAEHTLTTSGGKLVLTSAADGTDTVSGDIESLRFTGGTKAEQVTVSQESVANTLIDGDQTHTTVLGLASGGFLNFWLGGDGYYFRKFDANGIATGLEVKLLDSSTSQVNDQVRPAVFADGSFVLAWAGNDASESGTYVQRFDQDGKALIDKFRVNDTITGNQAAPAIAVLSDGSYVVAWTSALQGDSQPLSDGTAYLDTPNQAGVFAQRFDGANNPLGWEMRISPSGGGDAFITALKNGSFLVGYEAIATYTYADDPFTPAVVDITTVDRMTAFAKIYDSNGDLVQDIKDTTDTIDQTEINTNFESKVLNSAGTDNELRKTSKYPVAATLENGTSVVVWQAPSDRYVVQSGDSNYDRSIWYRMYDTSGNALFPQELIVNTVTQYEQGMPAVAALKDASGAGNGGFVVVWQSFNQDGSFYGIYGQRFDKSGNTVGSEFQVNTKVADNQKMPSVTGLADGGFVVSWEAQYQDGVQEGKFQDGAGGTEIVMQRYDASGNKAGLSIAGGAADDTLVFGGPDSIAIYGAAGVDTITSAGGNDTLRGGDGDDILDGAAGSDVIVGGAGDDTITGGAGDDVILGDTELTTGDGSDTLVLTGAMADYEIKGSNGVYDITDKNTADGDDGHDTLYGVESLKFTDGIKTLAGDTTSSDGGTGGTGGTGLGVTLDGDVNMVIVDVLENSTDFNDTLTGGNKAGFGKDTLVGGKGDDLYIAAGNQLIIYDTSGKDTLQTSTETIDLSNPVKSKNIQGLESIENVTLTGTKALKLTGSDVANVLIGNDAANTIKGNAGSDKISGGLGKDILTGGADNDIFVFDAPAVKTNADKITDFSIGDTFNLSGAIFTGLDPDKDGVINFLSGSGLKSAAADTASFIVYDTKAGGLYYDPEGGAAVLIATLAKVSGVIPSSVDASDFSLI